MALTYRNLSKLAGTLDPAGAQRARLEAICENKSIDKYCRIREALGEFVAHGQLGDNGFYVVFKTHHPDVNIPDYIFSKYSEQMTILIQHQFWDLSLKQDGFDIVLSFEKARNHLYVPFSAIIAFQDERCLLDYCS